MPMDPPKKEQHYLNLKFPKIQPVTGSLLPIQVFPLHCLKGKNSYFYKLYLFYSFGFEPNMSIYVILLT